MAGRFPHGGGACGELVRSIDWSKSPLGPMARWPASLRTTLQMLLNSRHPMFLWWGPELIQFYNDAYVPSFGRGKHPAAMGQRGSECWSEIWSIIGPQIEGVMERGEPTWHEDALVPILRNGGIEEVYWTYGYSPVFDDDGVTSDDRGTIKGTLVVCTETTARFVESRRQLLLRELAEQISITDTPRALTVKMFSNLTSSSRDIPFAGWLDDTGDAVNALAGPEACRGTILTLAKQLGPLTEARTVSLPWPVDAGPWPEPVRDVFAVPAFGGIAIFAISPRLPFDPGYRIFFEQIVDAIGAARERREAFATRAAAEAERRDLLLQAPVATALMTGPAHLFELANPHYVEMVGREVRGKTYLEAFPELANTALPGILADVYQKGIPFVTNELKVPLDRDGSGIPKDCYFKFNLEPIRDADGVVFGMMAVAVEITEVVRASQERNALISQLEAASRAKDEFLALLGHELRNPLSPIITALDLIKARGVDVAAREHEIIGRQVTHLTRLVDDLLDVSRIVQGKVELRRELSQLSDVVTKAIEIAADLLEQRQHQLDVSLPPDPISWWGDPMRLAQVIANLLTNAARYTEREGRISLTVEPAVHGFQIVVTDNGNGIAPEVLPTIFERFVQGGHRSTSSAGLGIGLALVKSLVELHGGTVHATSEGLGRGSRFVIQLPIGEPEVSDAPARPRTITAERRRRVLLVDDNIDAVDVMADLLRANGHEVQVAHDAMTALAVLCEFHPDVAVFDIGLPVIDGYELAQRALDLLGDDPIRLIAMTGYGQDRDRDRAEAAGFALHLVKPVKLDALLDAIAV